MRPALETFIWDLDGTLYEDERVYDQYAQELSSFLSRNIRARYLSDWAAAKAGHGVARIGLGYDETLDRLFRFAGDRILGFIDWAGRIEGQPKHNQTAPEHAAPSAPAIEAPIFGLDRFSIGDLWQLPSALAAHYGVSRDQRSRAFAAVRAYMSGETYQPQPEPRLRELLATLAQAGKLLVAMTNSPAATTYDVLERLGLRDCFALVFPSSQKPAGLTDFLNGDSARGDVLSVGDNFVNDIEPALTFGSHALYIDRYQTGLGSDLPSCYHVRSIRAAIDWVFDYCREPARH